MGASDAVTIERLELAEELELIRQMIQFNDVLEESVRELEPHRMVFYLLDLAGEFHRYYNRQRVITEDVELSRARLLLIENVQRTVRRGLEILGIDAPLKMAARADNGILAAHGERRGVVSMAENRRGKDNRFYFSRGQMVLLGGAFTLTAAIIFVLGDICRQKHRGK